MVSEDFSFPKVRNPVAHFSLSPSLWRVTSLVYPDYDQDESDVSGENTIECETEKDANVGSESQEDKNGLYCVQREVMNREDVHVACEELLSDETMDMLWERLNEEQQRVEEKMKMAKICSVNELKMSKAASSMLSQKTRPRMVVLVKALKKLFLLHNSAKFKNP